MRTARVLRLLLTIVLMAGLRATQAADTPLSEANYPAWLLWLSIGSLLLSLALGGVITSLMTLDRRRQQQLELDRNDDEDLRKSLDSQLNDSNRRLRAMFDKMPVGMALTRSDGSYIETNAHWCQMLGYTHDEMRTLNYLPITHPDDIASSKKDFSALVAGEIDSYALDKRFIRKDGSVFWASLAVSPILDQHGAVESVIGIIQDINERKLAEERLRRILRELPIAAVVINGSGQMAYQSEKFEALFGYSYDEVGSMDNWLPRAYPNAPYREKVEKIIAEMVAESKRENRASKPAEVHVRCKDGSDKLIEFQYVDLVEQGIWTMNDITERNKTADAMRAANAHLKERLEEIHGLQEKLRDQAMRDALTGLFNRRYLDEMLERELSRAMREGNQLSVMMLDLDHFKKLNDTYGHQAGDQVLKTLSDMLRKNARTEDIPCRYGGEEFMLVLPNMKLDDAKERAEQLRSKFEAMHINFGQFTMAGTLSIGIAAFPGHGRTRDELIDAADKALYLAKRNGRNRIEVFQKTNNA